MQDQPGASDQDRIAQTAPLIALFGAMAVGLFGLMSMGFDQVLPVSERAADRVAEHRGTLLPMIVVEPAPSGPRAVPSRGARAAWFASAMPAPPPVADSAPPITEPAVEVARRDRPFAMAAAAMPAAPTSLGVAPPMGLVASDPKPRPPLTDTVLAALLEPVGLARPNIGPADLPAPSATTMAAANGATAPETMADIALSLALIAPAAAPPDAPIETTRTESFVGAIDDWAIGGGFAPRLSIAGFGRFAAFPPTIRETLGGHLMTRTAVRSVDAVRAHFDSIDYDLGAVRETSGTVPRLYLETLPPDLREVTSVETKKAVFILAVLPVILRVNEEILADRAHLRRLREQLSLGVPLSPIDERWLNVLADRYGLEPRAFDQLLRRIDVIPASLALAQAAEESGWGTSRFAREGNALFGQYTFKAKGGIVPKKREAGRAHRIRAYENLLETVRSYMGNLNTHRAYRAFRARRAALRDEGKSIDGYLLAGDLKSYSERGDAYIRTLRQIIGYNRLGDFDGARLHDRQWTQADDESDGQRS